MTQPCGQTRAWQQRLSRATPAGSLSRRLLSIAGPLALQNFVNYSIGIVLLAFVGRLGEFELSVLVLASSLYNVTGAARGAARVQACMYCVRRMCV